MNRICKFCGEPIPIKEYDSLGRRLTRVNKYCCKAHRNADIKQSNQEFYKSYYKEYYKQNPEKYRKVI